MPYHHTAQPGPYRFFKRIQFHAVQTFTRKRQDRQCLMGIHIRISMSRKMLTNRKNTSTFQTTGISNHLIRHTHRVLTKRTIIDNRILRIDIHIRHRGKIDLYTKLTALTSHFTAILINQLIILYTSQYHIARKKRSTAKAHRQSPFPVKSNHQRKTCHTLRLIGEDSLCLHFSTGK